MKNVAVRGGIVFALLCGGWASRSAAASADPGGAGATTNPAEVSRERRLEMLIEDWPADAICYSGYREGQSPDTGVHPTKQQILEDLRILAKNWKLMRVYGAGRYSEDVLDVIRREGIDLKVMLGAWLAREPGNEAANAREIENCIRLANEYADVVVAVSVGNEVLVEWTSHPVPEEKLLTYVRRVKAGVSVPVTVADNYAWWRDHGAKLADEVDFVTIHVYPVWERKDIDDGMSYTIENYESVKAALPGKTIIIGEAGWPTYTEGNLHVPRAGDEHKQKRYYQELMRWAKANKITVFVFEAFDEPWKGTGTEGHWGLFSVDRQAKLCMQPLYPERFPSGPTSPSYTESRSAAHGPQMAVAFRSSLAGKIGAGTVNPHGPAVPATSVREIADAVEGDASLKFAHDGSDWGGLYLLFDPFDAGAYKKLVISLKIPDKVKSLELKIEGPPTRAHSFNLLQHLAGQGPRGWKTYAVSLSSLSDVDPSKLAIIGLWNPRDKSGAYVACEIAVDDIHFE